MRKISLVAAFLLLSASASNAQERAVDGVLGGVAGALVGGPIGLVAGAVVGVTAGPAISSSWGMNGSGRHYARRHRHRRYANR